MIEPFEQQFPASFNKQTVIECLAENTNFSKQQLKQFMQKGAVWLQTKEQSKPRRIRRAKKNINIEDTLFFYFNKTVLESKIPAPQLICDKVDFSVWYKPKGVLCQGSKWADHTTINRWIETEYKFEGQSRPAIIVHRLDKATDGLMLIAHNHKMAAKLTRAFTARKLIKIYHAIVQGKFLGEETYDQPIDNKPALSFARALEYNEEENCTKLEVSIKTGRKHQIRKHLSQAGFPIVGDRLYGTEETYLKDLQLTSVYLELDLGDKLTEKVFKFSLKKTSILS